MLKYAGILLNPNLSQKQVEEIITKDIEAGRIEHERQIAYVKSIKDPELRYQAALMYAQLAIRSWMGF